MERVEKMMREETCKDEEHIKLEYRIVRQHGEVWVVSVELETLFRETYEP